MFAVDDTRALSNDYFQCCSNLLSKTFVYISSSSLSNINLSTLYCMHCKHTCVYIYILHITTYCTTLFVQYLFLLCLIIFLFTIYRNKQFDLYIDNIGYYMLCFLYIFMYEKASIFSLTCLYEIVYVLSWFSFVFLVFSS